MGDTLFDVSALELDEAERLRFEMDQAKQRATEAEAAAVAARKAATEQLEKSQAARDKAAGLSNDVAALVKQRDDAAQQAAMISWPVLVFPPPSSFHS